MHKLHPTILLAYLLFQPLSSLSWSEASLQIYSPYIDILPFPYTLLSATVPVPITLDETKQSFDYHLSSDPEKFALDVARPMGKTLPEVWSIASEVKRLSKNKFNELVLATPQDNVFTIHSTLIYASPDNERIHAFTHAHCSNLGPVIIKFYNYTRAHFAQSSLLGVVENLFLIEYKATTSSAKELSSVFEKIGIAASSPGWNALDLSQPPFPKEHLPLLQQGDYDQSNLFANFPPAIARSVLLANVFGGILDPMNPERTGESFVETHNHNHRNSRDTSLMVQRVATAFTHARTLSSSLPPRPSQN